MSKPSLTASNGASSIAPEKEKKLSEIKKNLAWTCSTELFTVPLQSIEPLKFSPDDDEESKQLKRLEHKKKAENREKERFEREYELITEFDKVIDRVKTTRKEAEVSSKANLVNYSSINQSFRTFKFKCATCGNSKPDNTVTDARSGDVICNGRDGQGCGQVVQDHSVNQEAASRNFEGEEDRNHFGSVPNQLMSDSYNMSTNLSAMKNGREDAKFKKMSDVALMVEMDLSNIGSTEHRTREGYKNKQKRQAFELIENLADNLNIHDAVRMRAKQEFSRYRDLREAVQQYSAVVAACIYLAYQDILLSSSSSSSSTSVDIKAKTKSAPRYGLTSAAAFMSSNNNNNITNNGMNANTTASTASATTSGVVSTSALVTLPQSVAHMSEDPVEACLSDVPLAKWTLRQTREWLLVVSAGKYDDYVESTLHLLVTTAAGTTASSNENTTTQSSQTQQQQSSVRRNQPIKRNYAAASAFFGTTTVAARNKQQLVQQKQVPQHLSHRPHISSSSSSMNNSVHSDANAHGNNMNPNSDDTSIKTDIVDDNNNNNKNNNKAGIGKYLVLLKLSAITPPATTSATATEEAETYFRNAIHKRSAYEIRRNESLQELARSIERNRLLATAGNMISTASTAGIGSSCNGNYNNKGNSSSSRGGVVEFKQTNNTTTNIDTSSTTVATAVNSINATAASATEEVDLNELFGGHVTVLTQPLTVSSASSNSINEKIKIGTSTNGSVNVKIPITTQLQPLQPSVSLPIPIKQQQPQQFSVPIISSSNDSNSAESMMIVSNNNNLNKRKLDEIKIETVSNANGNNSSSNISNSSFVNNNSSSTVITIPDKVQVASAGNNIETVSSNVITATANTQNASTATTTTANIQTSVATTAPVATSTATVVTTKKVTKQPKLKFSIS